MLSTGSVTRVPSPNNVVLSDGNTAWTGDADMEAALLSQGLTIRSINASYIEFDFHPKTPLFNFSFVFFYFTVFNIGADMVLYSARFSHSARRNNYTRRFIIVEHF